MSFYNLLRGAIKLLSMISQVSYSKFAQSLENKQSESVGS